MRRVCRMAEEKRHLKISRLMTPHPSKTPILPAPPTLLTVILLAQISFGLLAMTMCLPSMQEWGILFGASQAIVQLTFRSFVFAYATCQLIYGPLSDRYGRKRILLTGLALACVGSLWAAASSDLAGLIGARMLQGAGSAAGMVVGRALVQDLFPGPQRTRIMAYIGMSMSLCPPLAMLVGGQIHVRLGWRGNFVLIAFLSLMLLLTSWRGLPVHQKTSTPPKHLLHDMLNAYARLAREPVFLFFVVIVSMATATFYTFLGGAPIVLRSYGIGPEDIGWYIMFVSTSYMLGNLLTSYFIRHAGERRLMVIGQTSCVSGIVLMLALGLVGIKSPLAFAAPLILLGLGHGLMMPPALAGSVGVIPAIAGAAAAVAGFMQQSMGAFGGYVVGLMPHDGAVNLGLLMLGFTLCGVAAQFALSRR